MSLLSIIIISVLVMTAIALYWRSIVVKHKLINRQAQLSQDLNLYKTGLKSLMGVFNSRSRMLEALKTLLSEKNGKPLLSKEINQLQKQFVGADNWQEFLNEYEKIEIEWLTHFNAKYALTTNDKKILIMQRLQLNNADMQAVMNVSSEGLKKAKSRLKKKLSYADIDQLNQF